MLKLKCFAKALCTLCVTQVIYFMVSLGRAQRIGLIRGMSTSVLWALSFTMTTRLEPILLKSQDLSSTALLHSLVFLSPLPYKDCIERNSLAPCWRPYLIFSCSLIPDIWKWLWTRALYVLETTSLLSGFPVPGSGALGCPGLDIWIMFISAANISFFVPCQHSSSPKEMLLESK